MNRPARCLCFACCLLVFGVAALRADEPAESRPAEREGGHAPALVSLDLWAVTLGPSEQQAADEDVGHLLDRVANLPAVVGQREAVRALVSRLENQGVVRRLQEFRLTTVDRHKAELAVGASKPRVTATSLTQFGTTNSVIYEPVGTQVRLTPHVAADGSIRVNVDFESHDLGKARETVIATPVTGESLFAPELVSLQVKTIVRVTDGEAVLLAGPVCKSQAATEMHIVILSAGVVKSDQ